MSRSSRSLGKRDLARVVELRCEDCSYIFLSWVGATSWKLNPWRRATLAEAGNVGRGGVDTGEGAGMRYAYLYGVATVMFNMS